MRKKGGGRVSRFRFEGGAGKNLWGWKGVGCLREEIAAEKAQGDVGGKLFNQDIQGTVSRECNVLSSLVRYLSLARSFLRWVEIVVEIKKTFQIPTAEQRCLLDAA